MKSLVFLFNFCFLSFFIGNILYDNRFNDFIIPSADSKSNHATTINFTAVPPKEKLLKFTSGIRCILEDSKGNIWFGSHREGAALLRNGALTYYTDQSGLSDNQVRNIYEDRNGNIWFECGSGLSTYDGKSLAVYKDRNYFDSSLWNLHADDLWFKGDYSEGYSQQENKPGVYQYTIGRLTFRTFPVEIRKGEENYFSVTTPPVRKKDGSVWFGTYGAVFGYDGNKFTTINNETIGLDRITGYLHIRSLMADSKGDLWIGNNGIGVIKYDGKTYQRFSELQNYNNPDYHGHKLKRVFSIGEDQSGNIWFGTVASGVWKYDGKALTNYSKSSGFQCEEVWTIYNSKKGELWFGCASPSGVYKFTGKSFERIF